MKAIPNHRENGICPDTASGAHAAASNAGGIGGSFARNGHILETIMNLGDKEMTNVVLVRHEGDFSCSGYLFENTCGFEKGAARACENAPGAKRMLLSFMIAPKLMIVCLP